MNIMIFGLMPDEGGEPQEIKEFNNRLSAILFMREQESTSHPDITYWAEDSNGNEFDSCADINPRRTPCS